MLVLGLLQSGKMIRGILEINAFNSVGSFRIRWQTFWYLISSKGRCKLVLC